MIIDSLFHRENKPLRKLAFLVTIPCAILPILIATAGFMSIPFEPLFFKNDIYLFSFIYLVYTYGLFLSWQYHRKWTPAILFAIHLISQFAFVKWGQFEWLGYLPIMTIIGTSLLNQYYRVGSLECNDPLECSKEG